MWLFDGVDDFRLSTAEIREIAEQDKKTSGRNDRLRVAIVSASPLVFGLARMWEAFYDDGPWHTNIFKNVEDAEAWLFA